MELLDKHGPYPKVPKMPKICGVRQLPHAWVSPFAPKDSEAWPHSNSKTYWIGPFDLQRNREARAASKDTSREPAHLRELQELAEIHQSDGDYAAARFCLASIAEHYISARTNIIVQRYTEELDHQTKFLHHKIKTTIGRIINTYFVQFPDFSSVADEEGLGYLSYFNKVVEKEGGYGDPEALYTTRVILCYCSQELQYLNLDWLCKVHRQVLSIAEPVYGLNNPDIIHLLRGTARAIETHERWRARGNGMGPPCLHARRMDLGMTRWKYEAEALLLRALSGLQELHGLCVRAGNAIQDNP